MKFLAALILFVFAFGGSYAQKTASQADKVSIRKTITGFLNWYKKFQTDTSKKSYSVSKGGYPDTTTKVRIDFAGLEQYLDEYRKTRLVSETFTNSLKSYFADIDKTMAGLQVYNDAVKIAGWDIDPVLQTYEPEMIMDHIKQCKINKLYIIYRKALVSVHFSNYTDLLLVLSRQGNGHTWVIDFLGADASATNSLFRQ